LKSVSSGCENNDFRMLLRYLEVYCSKVSETRKMRDFYVNSCVVAQIKVIEGVNLCE